MHEQILSLISAVENGTATKDHEGWMHLPLQNLGGGKFKSVIPLAWKAYEGSLDAAEELHKIILPEWWLQHLGQNLRGWYCRIEKQGVSLPSGMKFIAMDTAAGAWLIMILYAYAHESKLND